MPKNTERKNENGLPRYAVCLYALAAVSLVLYLIARFCTPFANWFNSTVGAAVRGTLAHLTSWLPLSLAEILIYATPLLIVLVVVHAVRRHCGSWRQVFLFLGTVVSLFSLLFSLFVWGFGTGYFTDSLDKRMGLTVAPVSAEELYETALWLAAKTNETAAEVTFLGNGFSEMPYDLKEMGQKLLAAYAPVCEQYSFVQSLTSRVKPVLASKAMSYTHITGVYAYFTGEANINTHFPDYTIPYTAAHELAHQRGIARENEANFVAFLVTVSSSDPYVAYSGYLSMYE